jgi:cytochrome c-type biogenesis protein CcmH
MRRAVKALLGTAMLSATLAASAVSDANLSPAQVGRYDKLGHQMMCVCGCAQILIECNHVGCPDSDGMLHMLRASLAQGDGDTTILETFQAKYGPTVLAAPMLTKFNMIAWIVPPLVLLLGMGGCVLLIRKWREARATVKPAPRTAAYSAVRDRIRRETEL